MGSTYCKQCKIRCTEEEEIKRELCNLCIDKREVGDCKFLYCCQCRHQAENSRGYLPKNQRTRWICTKCNEKNKGRQYALMCQRCNKVYETNLLPPDEGMEKFVNCTRCADVLSDDIKSGKYKSVSLKSNNNFLVCVYPPEFQDVFEKWMKENQPLSIEAKKN